MKQALLYLSALTCISFETLQAQIPSYVPTTDLVGWYGFNGNANDASTAANHLTNNGATPTTDRYNVTNAAYNFSGATQYLVRNTPSFTFGATSSFTVSFWMFKPTLTYGIALMNSSGTNGNFIWNFQTGNTGSFQFGTNKQGSAWAWAQSTYAINQWYHVVGTFANGAMTLYIDGVQAATNTYVHTGALAVNLPFYVGRGHGGNYFSGKIDDIGIWTRVLTLAEIQGLYTGCDATLNVQPADVNATYGSNAEFGVGVTGTGVNYLWQSNIGNGWQSIPNSGQYSGVFTDTLTISNVTMINNNQLFRCIISQGASCGDTSDQAELTVCGEITQDPDDTTVFINFGAQFAANSNDPAATYVWQSDTGSGWWTVTNGGQYTGATTKTLAVNTVTMANDGQKFQAIITSGSCSDTTEEAELTVINNVGIDENDLLGIRVYPNPAKQFITIEIPASLMEAKYVVVDQVGKIVLAGTLVTLRTTLATHDLPAGVYVIRLGDAASQSFVILP
jgi:hypothetical protein